MLELLLLLVGGWFFLVILKGAIELCSRLIDFHVAHPMSSCLVWLASIIGGTVFAVWVALG